MMTALANILTSDKVKVDVARQLRVWSGNLIDDKDFEEGVNEILPIYDPPEDFRIVSSTKTDSGSKTFEGAPTVGPREAYNSATQNFAFSVNMPHYNVRDQLRDIKVKLTYLLLSCRCIQLTLISGSYASHRGTS
jgi:proline iminopeptidase